LNSTAPKGTPPIDGQHDGPERAGRPVKAEKFQAILSECPDAIAFFNARSLQAAGQSIHFIFVIGKGQRSLVINLKPCRLVSKTNRVALNEIIKTKVVESHNKITPLVY